MLEQMNLDYLRASPDPWVRYRTMLDLDGFPASADCAAAARSAMLGHPLVKGLLAELASWPGTVLNSHKSAGQHYHKLAFLAEIGLQAGDPGIDAILAKMLNSMSGEGLPRLPAAIPVHFGGNGQESLAWALCDVPLQLWILQKMGLGLLPEVRRGTAFLTGLVRASGWPCAVSPELGKFRGPGRKDDPCPYATLLMVKLLLEAVKASPLEDGTTGDAGQAASMARGIGAGLEILLELWAQSREQHPYMFYMGTDFRKLKAPFIWYDLLHVLDILSQAGQAANDSRFLDMLQAMNGKAGPDGLFTPESEWKAWNGWEFSQKKSPSAWLTFLAYRINRRAASFRDHARR